MLALLLQTLLLLTVSYFVGAFAGCLIRRTFFAHTLEPKLVPVRATVSATPTPVVREAPAAPGRMPAPVPQPAPMARDDAATRFERALTGQGQPTPPAPTPVPQPVPRAPIPAPVGCRCRRSSCQNPCCRWRRSPSYLPRPSRLRCRWWRWPPRSFRPRPWSRQLPLPRPPPRWLPPPLLLRERHRHRRRRRRPSSIFRRRQAPAARPASRHQCGPAPVTPVTPVPRAVVPAPVAPAPQSVTAAPSTTVVADDLTMIRAIDGDLQKQLGALGVKRFAEIADWKPQDVARVAATLKVPGRIEQENWIEQAQILAKGGETYYSRRKARGETTSSTPTPDEGERVVVRVPATSRPAEPAPAAERRARRSSGSCSGLGRSRRCGGQGCAGSAARPPPRRQSLRRAAGSRRSATEGRRSRSVRCAGCARRCGTCRRRRRARGRHGAGFAAADQRHQRGSGAPAQRAGRDQVRAGRGLDAERRRPLRSPARVRGADQARELDRAGADPGAWRRDCIRAGDGSPAERGGAAQPARRGDPRA